jgi:hypothetical protein
MTIIGHDIIGHHQGSLSACYNSDRRLSYRKDAYALNAAAKINNRRIAGRIGPVKSLGWEPE